MRILVTGVTGQIGSALVHRLQSLGTVMAASRAMIDLSRPDEIAGRLDAIAPDLIVNSAAFTAVDRAEHERDVAFTINAESPGVMARWAAVHRVPLVSLSTDYVFNGSGSRPWREEDLPEPLSVYGESKLAGENAIRRAGGPHLVVRTSWIYAAQGRNFLCAIAQKACEHTELKVVADQIGAPTSAAIVADALARILSRSPTQLEGDFAKAGGIVHLAADGATSWHGFATAIVSALKQRAVAIKAERVTPVSTDEYPASAARPRNSRLDLGRLAQVFGIKPVNWAVALEPELDQLAPRLKSR